MENERIRGRETDKRGKEKGGGDIDCEWGREKGLLGKETHAVFACREFLVADPYGK